MEEQGVGGHAPWLAALWGQKGVLELWDVTRKNDKHLITHMNLHKTKQQVDQCIVETLLVLGQATSKLKLTRFTTSQTQGKPPLSPLQYTLCLSTRPTSKWHFVPGLPFGSSKIPKVGSPTTLGSYNFVCRPLIKMRSKEIFQPSLRAFQQYIARYLHAKKLGQFLTFSGRESNIQFNFRPFFWP